MVAHPRRPTPLPAHFTAAQLPLTLRFGSHRTTLRRLEPDDDERLLAFFHSHNEETICQRYGRAAVEITPETARRLVSVDQTRDAALGVFETGRHGQRLVAIGRYCLAKESDWAEVAFVVHEERRGLGIATTLLAALIAIARERRLRRLVAEVRHDNGPMIHVFRAAGAEFSGSLESSSMRVTLALEPRISPA